jgi:beta-glucosidase/6-phospho-beta-glucosidase/beta-galactosidase
MIRKVAFSKAILAGLTGAIAWEVAARVTGLLLGAPLFDIVHLLGTTFTGEASPWLWWPMGMAAHLLVGAIWAVFYAYFFWSTFDWRPVRQGLAFTALPILLATFVMRPQLELMNPLVAAGRMPFSGLHGLDADWRSYLGLVLGHLIWGSTLGALYTRPVGSPTSHPLALPVAAGGEHRRRKPTAAPLDDHSGFLFATGIECSYPTIESGRWRVDEMEMAGHYANRRTDLDLTRQLGLRYLRYGPPLHLIYRAEGRYDWAWLDEVMAEMQRLGIVPIVDLCHFGVPDWLENFQNPRLPVALASFGGAFAKRYPWVRFYTPVNEMYVCARLSALDGLWNEQMRSEEAFVKASCHLAKAAVLMRQAIQRVRPDAVFVNNESSEFFQPCCPDPEIQRIAAFENERRFLPLDFLHAHPVSETMRAHLVDHGMPLEEYQWFMAQPVPDRSILGVDYYPWNEKLITREGRAEALGELFGWTAIAGQYYERYRRPLMHTETNSQDAREGPHWLWRQWHNVNFIRQSGVPVVGFTWYSLVDQIDWDIGIGRPLGNVTPVGLFDLNRDPRPVALSYRELIRMYANEPLLNRHMRELLGVPDELLGAERCA